MTTRFFNRTALALSALAFAACGGPVEEAQEVKASAVAAAANLAPDAALELYANFLQTYISQEDGINFVAYGDVTEADHLSLKTYISSLEASGIEGMSEDEQMAFWINLYNAKTLDIIIDNYPLKSIRSLGALNSGPWNDKVVNVAGFGEMSLNNIEHDTLRAQWDEPRIHYAVNCASYGCPNLSDEPWTAETLEDQFYDAAVDYINHPRGVRVEDGSVIASKIYDWYKVDFGDSNDGILEHVREYAEGDLADALDEASDIRKFEYDWSLNGKS